MKKRLQKEKKYGFSHGSDSPGAEGRRQAVPDKPLPSQCTGKPQPSMLVSDMHMTGLAGRMNSEIHTRDFAKQPLNG